jgi:hypothetical protein
MADGQAAPAKIEKKKTAKKGAFSVGNIDMLAETIKQMVELAKLEERADAMRKELGSNNLAKLVTKGEKKKKKKTTTTKTKKPKDAQAALPHAELKPKKKKKAAEQGKKMRVVMVLPASQV